MSVVSIGHRARTLGGAFGVAALACGLGAAAAAGSGPVDRVAGRDVDVDRLLTVIAEWGCPRSPERRPGDAWADVRVGANDLLAVLTPDLSHGDIFPLAAVEAGRVPVRGAPGPVAMELNTATIGLAYGGRMLAREASRFVIAKGLDDFTYFYDLWMGTYDPADGEVAILPAPWYDGDPSVTSLAGAVMDAHSHAWAPEPLPCPQDWMLPRLNAFGTVRVKPIPLTEAGWSGPYFRLKYQLICGEPWVRVTSEAVEGGVTRTVEADFRFDKQIGYAVVSPCRVRIGKNVRIDGGLGTRYGSVGGELDHPDGDPLTMRSDFQGLDEDLDATLSVLFEQVAAFDADGDGRLGVTHPQESQGIASAPGDLVDHDQDGYVDDFDLFLHFYDANSDGGVVYDQILANEAGHGLPAEEFADIDDQLARLIDEARPDRDGDGGVTMGDRVLGYRDGILDIQDRYAKVRGAAWSSRSPGMRGRQRRASPTRRSSTGRSGRGRARRR